MLRVRRLRSNEAAKAARLIYQVIIDTPYYSVDERDENVLRYTPAEIRAAIARDPDAILVACDGERIVGFCVSEHDGGPLYLRWIGVHRKWRGRGIALRLLTALQRTVARRGAYKLYGDTVFPNTPISVAFSRAGFRPAGIQWEWQPPGDAHGR